jgi:hypothetical protein
MGKGLTLDRRVNISTSRVENPELVVGTLILLNRDRLDSRESG